MGIYMYRRSINYKRANSEKISHRRKAIQAFFLPERLPWWIDSR